MTALETGVNLEHVDWPAAIEAAAARHVPGLNAASIESLSALYTDDAATALKRLRHACELDPFQPLHRLRLAMTLARFGATVEAAAELDALSTKVPATAVVDYLRALFALRGGMLERARGLSGGLETVHPKLVQGKFLRAEVQLVAAKPSTVEKYLAVLPRGKQWEPLWADLLIKLILLHPQEGPAAAGKHLAKAFEQQSVARALVERVLSWARMPLAELATLLAATPADTRTEEILLAVLLECVSAEADLAHALKSLRSLGYETSARRGMRLIYDMVLTRRAAELAAKGEHEGALRLVEQSFERQPYDPIHHQNRAALFTLMREAGPYAEAWAEMNAHQYRLLLLGSYDAATLLQIVKTHRLFASQARAGIFRTVKDEEGGKPRLVTNSDQMAADPELLRQWMHHRRAAYVVEHLTMADDARRALLDPADRDSALVRAEALVFYGRSLSVLTAEEGVLLGAQLEPVWRGLAERIPARYDRREFSVAVKTETDAEQEASAAETAGSSGVAELYREHFNTLAELLLICLQWSPDAGQMDAAEELLAWTSAECAFLDDRLLEAMIAERGYETPYALVVLSGRLSEARAKAHGTLTREDCRAVLEVGMAELLRTMSYTAREAFRGSDKERTLHAMAYVDRARRLDPSSADVELTAARWLEAGEFFEEARLALERFQRIVKEPSERQLETANKLAEILRQRSADGKTGERRVRGAAGVDDAGVAVYGAERLNRTAELEHELERSPRIWSLYNELAKELAAAGRFDDAVACADRSVAQCLSRADQINARSLAIEMRGIQALAADDVQAARLVAVGAHEPARLAVEAKALRAELSYVDHYLLGRCLLAAGRPAEAQASFERALAACTRPLHSTVLRGLAADIDSAYRAFARSAVNRALEDGRHAEAMQQAGQVFSALKDPASWLLDMARICYTVALGSKSAATPLALPKIAAGTAWAARLQQALAAPSDGRRALALAELAEQLHPSSLKAAQALAERARVLNARIEAAAVLSSAGIHLRERDFAGSLCTLEAADAAIAAEPRVQRMRALALLGLRRFAEADAVVASLTAEAGAAAVDEIAQFVTGYPELRFRQQLAVALEHLRGSRAGAAQEVLNTVRPANDQQAGELAYCQAFRCALDGYELKRKGPEAAAQPRFLEGLRLLEPLLTGTGGGTPAHVSELYDRLEKEVEQHGR